MKKLQKMFAMLLTVIMVMSLLNVSAFAAGETCGQAAHTHTDDCHRLVVDAEKCTAEEHGHTGECNHVHSVEAGCYELNCTTQYDCAVEYDCTNTEEGHQHAAECPAHTHVDGTCTAHTTHGDGCYDLTTPKCTKTDEDLDCTKTEHTHTDDCKKKEKICAYDYEHVHDDSCYAGAWYDEDAAAADDTWSWDAETLTLTLDGAELADGVTLPAGATVVVNGECSIAAGDANAIESEGAVTVTGDGKLTLTGANGIMAASVAIEGIDVDFNATSCGIQVFNDAGDAKVTLTNVDGSITGGYAGVYVNGECTETEAAVVIDGCDLDVTSTATSYNNRARKSGITVYVSTAELVESSITIANSTVNAIGSDAGLAINNYLGDADATNSASSRINITNSTVVAEGTNGTWSGIFASVLGQHPDADSTITITDSSVYAVSPNTGILTSSQRGESGIVLNNSILGAEGKTALSMIEETSQTQAAEIKNGSTYVQMTPDAVMKGEIVNFEGKTIMATAGDGITYDAANNYYVIPQGSAVTETFTNGTVNEYTFNKQAGGIGGDYAKEEIWGYDVSDPVKEIIITTPEELIDFATRTQEGGDLGNCEGWTVKLGADIDMSGYDWYYRNAEGEIVTDHRIPEFSGIFNGQGYAIKGMSYRDEYAAATEETMLSVFLTFKTGSEFKNLTIDGITVDTVAPARFGGLLGDGGNSGRGISDVSVEKVTVKNVTVKATNPNASFVFGGLVWKVLGSAEFKECSVNGITVNAAGAMTGGGNGRSGGFLATGGEGGSTFTDCTVTGLNVTAQKGGTRIAGFVAGTGGSSYTRCKVVGFTLKADGSFANIGGFISDTAGNGWGENLAIDDCHVSGLDIDADATITGGFIGRLRDGIAKQGTITNCSAEGKISTANICGGFIGGLYKDRNFSVSGCYAAVNVVTDGAAGGFLGATNSTSTVKSSFANCTASGDVTGTEPIGISFLDGDVATVDGIIGGTYTYDPENVDAATGEVNNVAPGYRALDNGDGTWTVFPDLGCEVVKVAFHRWNDEQNAYENWRTVEVFKAVDFFQSEYNNALSYSHPEYRFANGIGELDEEADDKTARAFSYWTDVPNGTQLVLDNEIEVVADMNVYAAYRPADTGDDGGDDTGDTTVIIPEEQTPLPPAPDTTGDDTIILDEDVPLADVPTTGDPISLMAAVSIFSGAGVYFTRKRKDEE